MSSAREATDACASRPLFAAPAIADGDTGHQRAGGGGRRRDLVCDGNRARAATQKEMLSVATLIGNRSSAALLFQDERVALENLHALAGLDQIASACLFAERGALVAQFSSASAAPVHCLARQSIGRPFVQVGMLDAAVQLPVVANGNVVGAILINSAAAPLVQRLSAQFISLALALCGALLVAALLAVRLQRG